MLEYRKHLIKSQKKDLAIMKKIAKLRKDLTGIRIDKNEDYYKEFFVDYSEKFICDMFKLKRADPNQEGYDAKTITGKRVQIKDCTHSLPYFEKELKFDYAITIKLNKSDFSPKEIHCYTRNFIIKNLNDNYQFRPKKRDIEKYSINLT